MPWGEKGDGNIRNVHISALDNRSMDANNTRCTTSPSSRDHQRGVQSPVVSSGQSKSLESQLGLGSYDSIMSCQELCQIFRGLAW